MSTPGGWVPRTRVELARRVARDIEEGWFVNLGIGIPTLVADHIPPNREVVFHSENGVLGVGPAPEAPDVDPWLINASKQPVTLRPGGAFFDTAAGFGMIRGGRVDLCVLGAFEVASNGDLANWATADPGAIPAVGGAMDLAVGARRVWVATEHTTRGGLPKLLERCTCPLTALGRVSRVYTDLATIDVTPRGFRLVDMVDGLDFETLQSRTRAAIATIES